ncbi:MAG: hypothetical protein NTW08_08600 [Gammaproteobacteria bacterium]|nr:hypothetical protein [Gammaproteobacteria bacterium]
MPYPYIDMDTTSPVNRTLVESGKKSHDIRLATISGSKKTWVVKEMEDELETAQRECLAQEFFRLIIRHQPETKLGFDKKTKQYVVLSEEVEGYRAFPSGESQKFSDGTYTGLGHAMACALFLQEVDLKNGNIGLDKHQRVIKIDGDWCFSQLKPTHSEKGYALTPEGLHNLPRPVGFYTFNWLDLTRQGFSSVNSQIIPNDLQMNPRFRDEVNQALARIIFMPTEVMERLAEKIVDKSEREQYVVLLKERQFELKLAASENPSFVAYADSLACEQDLLEYHHMHLSRFQVAGKPLNDDVSPLDWDVELLLNKNAFMTELDVNRVKSNCCSLVRQLDQLFDMDDELMNDYVGSALTQCRDDEGDLPEITQLQVDLQQVVTAQLSAEVVAIKQLIKQYRSQGGPDEANYRTKANELEDALFSMDLKKRGQAITEPGGMNPVQQLLKLYPPENHAKSGFFKSNTVTTSRETLLDELQRTFQKPGVAASHQAGLTK